MYKNKKSFFDYMWIASILYLLLGFFNILFAWLGMICFIVPLVMAFAGKGKAYCNNYCGRGQLLNLLGNKYKLSRGKDIPKFMKSKGFRYGFLVFFLTMFSNMVFYTVLVFKGQKNIRQVITLLWTFKFPWNWVNISGVSPWLAQFAYGFFSLMLTSTILGIITMFLYKARSWCVYCPMGTMTHAISKMKLKGN